MSGAGSFLFSTTGAVCLLAAAVVAVVLRPRSSVVRGVALVVAGAYVLASTYVVPAAVANMLAGRYHRFERADAPAGRVALVIFGAGDEQVAGWTEHVAIPSAVATARVIEAWRVYRIIEPAWIISSGGNPSPDDHAEPTSVNMQRMLIALGVPASRIVLESSSRDSHDEAVAIAPLLKSLGADSQVLVTSSIHMRRSLGACRAAGWNPVPAVAPDPWFGHDWFDWLTPSNHALYFSGQIAHELVGLPYYGVRGWLR